MRGRWRVRKGGIWICGYIEKEGRRFLPGRVNEREREREDGLKQKKKVKLGEDRGESTSFVNVNFVFPELFTAYCRKVPLG